MKKSSMLLLITSILITGILALVYLGLQFFKRPGYEQSNDTHVYQEELAKWHKKIKNAITSTQRKVSLEQKEISSQSNATICFKNQTGLAITAIITRKKTDAEKIAFEVVKLNHREKKIIKYAQRNNPVDAIIVYTKENIVPEQLSSLDSLPEGGATLSVAQAGWYIIRGRKNPKLFGRPNPEKSTRSMTKYYRVLQTPQGPIFDDEIGFIVHKTKYETEKEKKNTIRKSESINRLG